MHSREAIVTDAQIDEHDEHDEHDKYREASRRGRSGSFRRRLADKPVDPVIEAFSQQLAARFSEEPHEVAALGHTHGRTHSRTGTQQRSVQARQPLAPRPAATFGSVSILVLAFCLGAGFSAAGAAYYFWHREPASPIPVAQAPSPVPAAPSTAVALPEPTSTAPAEPAPAHPAVAEQRTAIVEAAPLKDQKLGIDETRELQTLLIAAGLTPGPVDGVVGPMTEAAVRQYEEREGLGPSGIASRMILQRLRATPASSADSSSARLP